MMLCLIGTLPIKDLGIRTGKAHFENGKLLIDDLRLEPSLGTSVMTSAACLTCQSLGIDEPHLITVGDIGDGKGSTTLYRSLSSHVAQLNPAVLGMHYIMPNITHIKMVLESFGDIKERMKIIADAGSMYAAKAAGVEGSFDIFTPDAGEMAYLADPDATHPAYVKHLLFSINPSEIETLIQQAYKNGNIPHTILVKGPIDYIVHEGVVTQTIQSPSHPAMEAIGGTGDSLTGILSALVAAGYEQVDACIRAARINRIAGELAHPNPSTPVAKIIENIPNAVKEVNVCA